jgi:transposase
VAQSVGVSVGAVGATLRRARDAGLTWGKVAELADDARLEARLYPRPPGAGRPRPLPDCVYLHTERRKPGVTLELLHLEYLEQHRDGYRYTQFCEIYRQWLQRRRLTRRQVHRAGEKGFVDYAGKTPGLIDPATGEWLPVELFVMALGASSYTYAEATATQQLPDWIASHTRAFAYYGGVPRAVVPDQLKSAVTIPCRYEPGIHRTYAELAAHYGTTILPARPAKPRDKAVAEVAVQVAERWIVARLRHETFYTLGALNERIAELLAELNAKPMRHYGGASRRPRSLRAPRAPAPAPPAGRALRVRRLAQGQRQRRLPHRRRAPLLFGPAHPRPAARAARRAPDSDGGRGLPPRPARRRAPAQLRAGPPHDPQ